MNLQINAQHTAYKTESFGIKLAHYILHIIHLQLNLILGCFNVVSSMASTTEVVAKLKELPASINVRHRHDLEQFLHRKQKTLKAKSAVFCMYGIDGVCSWQESVPCDCINAPFDLLTETNMIGSQLTQWYDQQFYVNCNFVQIIGLDYKDYRWVTLFAFLVEYEMVYGLILAYLISIL